MLLANSTTSRTAGVKHWEKESHTSWLDRLAGATGQALSGHACRTEGTLRNGGLFFGWTDSDSSVPKQKSHQHFGASMQLPGTRTLAVGLPGWEAVLTGQMGLRCLRAAKRALVLIGREGVLGVVKLGVSVVVIVVSNRTVLTGVARRHVVLLRLSLGGGV